MTFVCQIKSTPTDRHFARTVSFETFVQMLPDFWQPFDDLGELLEAFLVAIGRPRPGFDGLLLEVPAQESLDGFDVVGAENPFEVVVELQIRRGAAVGRLTHRPDDVRTAKEDGMKIFHDSFRIDFEHVLLKEDDAITVKITAINT